MKAANLEITCPPAGKPSKASFRTVNRRVYPRPRPFAHSGSRPVPFASLTHSLGFSKCLFTAGRALC